MDIEKFNQWSDQFQTMLSKLAEHEQSMQMARQKQASEVLLVSSCITQVAVEKHLSKMANDIRALGSCYNNLREAIYMQQEQFDALD
jgi:fumarate hydratase class II